MKPVDTAIPITFLAECFDLDPTTGVLTWRERPREHFATRRALATWRYAGTVAGGQQSDGYSQISLTLDGRKRCLKAHRVVFALVHGHWPVEQIDHRNGVRSDNRPGNLRVASNTENCHNQRIKRRNNTSGFSGVCWDKQARKWRAQGSSRPICRAQRRFRCLSRRQGKASSVPTCSP
jgi:hypothetical protein